MVCSSTPPSTSNSNSNKRCGSSSPDAQPTKVYCDEERVDTEAAGSPSSNSFGPLRGSVASPKNITYTPEYFKSFLSKFYDLNTKNVVAIEALTMSYYNLESAVNTKLEKNKKEIKAIRKNLSDLSRKQSLVDS